MKIFLASASPRRFELMSLLPFEFLVYISRFDEEEYKRNLKIINPSDICKEIALKKGEYAYKELIEKYSEEEIIVVSADTMVVLGNKIFGKGINEEISFEILKELNDKKHIVMTAVSIISNKSCISFIEESEVYFAKSSNELLLKYISDYKPFDKAGAYGIQDGGGLLVKKIVGSYHNIVGLPIRSLYENLLEIFDYRRSL